MAVRFDDVVGSLRTAYDNGVAVRDQAQKEPWKLREREAFLERIRADGATSLLELGAGTGQDCVFFQQNGLRVTAIDLSPAMVERCRSKGLDARCLDFAHLDNLLETYDAAYALNTLLHVPNADLPDVLANIRKVLRPGALFFLGVFGGDGGEGVLDNDWHDPPRFFSRRTDEQIQTFAGACFEIVDFHSFEQAGGHWPFQSLTLRRPLE